MKPYFETELGKLYNGDCLEVMEELIKQGIKVDAIITDPPYGMDYSRHIKNAKHDKIKNDNNLDWLDSYLKKAKKIMNDDSGIFMFCSYHHIDIFKSEFQKYFKLRNILIWNKGGMGMGDLKTTFGSTYEVILYGNIGRVELNGNRDNDVIENISRSGNELHPTQKPAELIQYLIEKITKKNDLVLDTFSGSGTLAEAAEQLKRRWICIELEEKYCKVTKQRFQKGIQQTLL